MAKISAFPKSGNWYKGNLHAHTTLSDGHLTPDNLVKCYLDNNYDFISITDHWLYGIHNALQKDNFLIFGGVEFNTPAFDGGGEYHTVAIANPKNQIFQEGYDFPEINRNIAVSELVSYMNTKKHMCIIAHPYWSQRRMSQLDNLVACKGIEIYNHICQLEYGCGYSNTYFDHFLWKGQKIFAFAADDTHSVESCANVSIYVKADSLSYDEILNAINMGAFYASMGPKIFEFYIKNDIAYVSCSPCCHISFHGENSKGFSMISEGNLLTYAEFPVGNAKYIYTVIQNLNGEQAWSQPIWLI